MYTAFIKTTLEKGHNNMQQIQVKVKCEKTNMILHTITNLTLEAADACVKRMNSQEAIDYRKRAKISERFYFMEIAC